MKRKHSQSKSVRSSQGYTKRQVLFRLLLITIPTLLVSALIPTMVGTLVPKSVSWLIRPKVDSLVSTFVVVQEDRFVNNQIRRSTALYDGRDQCLDSVINASGPPSSFTLAPPTGGLYAQVDLHNRGLGDATRMKLGFRFTLPGEVKIEATPNLTFTTEISKSELLGDEVIVTVQRLPAGAEGMVTARVAIPKSSFVLQTESTGTDAENVSLHTSQPTWFSANIHFLGMDQHPYHLSYRKISSEESIERFVHMVGSTQVSLLGRAWDMTGVQVQTHQILNGGCRTLHGGLALNVQ